jgi:hypothetical protein
MSDMSDDFPLIQDIGSSEGNIGECIEINRLKLRRMLIPNTRNDLLESQCWITYRCENMRIAESHN